jgi:transcriptional regulator with GAF, ATPase, and Fis domain
MNTAAQLAFEETAEFFSPMASRNHFQLLTDLTAQAARDVEFSTLIEGFVDSVARAFRCDCVSIALLDPEDPRAFREFLVQYAHDDRRVQQPPIISKPRNTAAVDNR